MTVLDFVPISFLHFISPEKSILKILQIVLEMKKLLYLFTDGFFLVTH